MKNHTSNLYQLCNTCLLTLTFLLLSTFSFSTSYTWNGSSSTAWGTAANWTPNAVPTSADNVTIVSATNAPQLAADVSVTNFTLTSGSFDLNGYNITVNGNATFTAGTLSGGSTDTLYLTAGTATFTGGTINPYIHAVVATLKFNGSTFNGKGYFEANTNIPGTGNGGSTFNDTISIVRSYSGSGNMNLANVTAGNTYNKPVTFINNGTGAMNITTYGASKFNDNIIAECNNTGGINFGSASSSDTLASGKTITIGAGGFTSGTLVLRNFIQLGSTAQTLTATSSATINCISAVFNGNATFTAPSFLSKATTFNGTFSSTQNGSSNVNWSGYNIFNSTATITNSSGSAYLRVDFDSADTFYGNVALINSSTGGIRFCHSNTTSLYGNLTSNSSYNLFNSSSTGTLAFRGGNYQTFYSPGALFNNVLMKKTTGTVTLDTSATITGTFTFDKGVMVTKSDHLLSFNATSSVTGASDSSFISGPIKKTGNSAFVFPTGSGLVFRKIGISAPANLSDAFVAEYFDGNHVHGVTSRQSSISYMTYDKYWNLNRINGTSNVQVALHWSNSAPVPNPSRAKIIRWSGTQWLDESVASPTGTSMSGHISTNSSLSSFGNLALAFSSIVFNPCSTTTHTPDRYYKFDSQNLTSSGIESVDLSTSLGSGNSFSSGGAPISGYSLKTEYNADNISTDGVSIDANEEYFAIEMFIRFGNDYMSKVTSSFFFAFKNPEDHFAYIEHDRISFITYYTDQIDDPTNTLQVDLNGIGRRSLDYYFDDNWHHVCFVHKKVNSNYIKQIWIDGELNQGFHNSFPVSNWELRHLGTLPNIYFKSSSNNSFCGEIDQIAFYGVNELCEINIAEHGSNNDLYELAGNTSPYVAPTKTLFSSYNPDDFPLNYAPGTGNYSEVKTSLNQLLSFPLPRYNTNMTLLKRNFNWLGTDYLAGYDPPSPQSAIVSEALDIQEELYHNWYYLYNICENTNSYTSDLNTAFIDYAKPSNPAENYESGITTYRAQMVYTHASLPGNIIIPLGVDSPWIWEQQIENTTGWQTSVDKSNFYLFEPTNSKWYHYDGTENYTIRRDNIDYPRYYWNYSPSFTYTDPLDPFTSNEEIYANDGLLQKFLLEEIISANGITAPIKIVSENNEVSHKAVWEMRNLIPNNPIILQFFSTYGGSADELDWEDYMGIKGRTLDNDYRSAFMDNISELSSTLFLNYAVDGQDYILNNSVIESVGPRYKYEYLRETQTEYDYPGGHQNVRLATPDFYPMRPALWLRESLGADHGFKWLTRSKRKELSYGDHLNAPFISPGWSKNEENNIRPGQWLGLLKATAMLGVDFFHVFANPEEVNYKGYAWQAVIPVYAHAVESRFEEFMDGGELLEGDVPQDPASTSGNTMYTFNAGTPNKLVVARKQDGSDKYVITGTVQPLSNVVGNAPIETTAEIQFTDGTISPIPLKFNIRRQGSTYVFDNVNPLTPIFYQLDEWHENKHPDRWSKDFHFDAEVWDNTSAPANVTRVTSVPGGTAAYDYRNFTTYISFASGSDPVEYKFHPRKDDTDYYVWIKAKDAGSGGELEISLNGFALYTLDCIGNSDWKWYQFEASSLAPLILSALDNQQYTLSINSISGNVLVDKIVIAEDKNLALQPQPDACGTLSSTFCVTSTYTISNNNLASGINADPPLPSDVIYLDGNFIIDEDFSFSDKTIICSPSSKISVQSGYKLVIENSHFFSCNSNWIGIELEDGNAEIEIDNSILENADKVIELLDKVTVQNISLTNSSFSNNDFGFYCEASYGELDFDNNLVVTNCKFTNTYNPIYIGMGKNFTIGSSSEGQNFYEGADFNISLIEPRDFLIENNYFKGNIEPSGIGIYIATTGGLYAGVVNRGIISNLFEGLESAITNIGSQAQIESNVISGCNFGIKTSFSYDYNDPSNYQTCLNNSIFAIMSGVSYVGCVRNIINISGNHVYNGITPDLTEFTSCINVSSMLNSINELTIDGNTINSDGDYGIRVADEQSTTTPVIVTNNSITDARIGIFALNCPSIKIGSDANDDPYPNKIYFNLGNITELDNYYEGIFVQNCPGGYITGEGNSNSPDISNNSTITTTGIGNFRGIDVENSANVRINCNVIANMPRSIVFTGLCGGSLMRKNNLREFEIGVDNYSSVFGDQGFNNGSSWETLDNEWDDSGNDFRVGGLISTPIDWHYRTSNAKYSPSPNQGGFTPVVTNNGTPQCDDYLRQYRDELYGSEVGDTLSFEEYVEAYTYLSKASAFDNMKREPSMLTEGRPTDDDFQDYFDDKDTLNIGMFTQIRIWATDTATIDDATVLNASIVPDNEIEENLQIVYGIYLTTLALGIDLSGTDSSNLAAIAAMNWVQAGEAIYLAASMLGLEIHPVLEPEPEARLAAQVNQHTDEISQNTLITVTPNPAKDRVTVSNLKVGNNLLRVYNSAGTCIESVDVNSSSYTLNVKNHPPGIYMLVTQSANNKYAGAKFAVVR